MKHNFIVILAVFLLAECGNSTEQKASTSQSKYPPEIAQLIQQSEADSTNIALKEQLINSLDSAQFYTEALIQLDKLIKHDSLNQLLWSQKGGILEKTQDTTAAIKCYLNSIKIYPTPVAIFSLAMLFAETKNPTFEIVAENIENVYNNQETRPHLYFLKGVYHARKGNTNSAQKYFDTCIQLNYHYLEAYMEKGFIFFDQHKIQPARTIFETIIKIDPMYADGYYWLGKCVEQQLYKDTAIEYYQKAFTLDPKLTAAQKAIERLN